MAHCIFCNIINKQIPTHIVFESDSVIAILDITQSTLGHTLVMPKTHHDNFVVAPSKVIQEVMIVAQHIAQKQMSALNAKGINTLINSYSHAGQSVMHFHVHLIPRYNESDQIKIEVNKHLELSKLDLKEIALKLR